MKNVHAVHSFQCLVYTDITKLSNLICFQALVLLQLFILHMNSFVSEGKFFTPLFLLKIGGFRGRKITKNKEKALILHLRYTATQDNSMTSKYIVGWNLSFPEMLFYALGIFKYR